MSRHFINSRIGCAAGALFAFVSVIAPIQPLAAQSKPQCAGPDCQLTLDQVSATVAQINQRKQDFVGALRQLTVALAGTFGDEGTRVRSSIESMDAALGEWERAILAFESELGQTVRSAEIHIALGVVYLDRYRLDDALREFTEASRLDSLRADAHTLQALVYDLLNRPAAAAEALAKASALDPGKLAVVYSRARHLAMAGQQEEAGKALRTFVESPQQQSIDRPANETGGAPFERVALLRQVAGVAPILPPALYAEAFTLLTQGAYRGAVDRLRQSAALDPLSSGWIQGDRLAQGSAALRNGDVRSAIDHLRAAIESAPDRAEAHRILGVAYREDDQSDNSVEQFRTAIRLNPSDERARIALADAFSAAGQDAQAERVLLETTESLPASGQAHYNLGRLYRLMARNIEAVRAFDQAAALNPLVGQDSLYETIGAIHVVEANFDSAVKALQKRVDVSPNNAEAHRKLGEVYLQLNRHDEALAELMVALLVDPQNSEAYAGIGQLQLQRGKYVEAAEASRRAVDLDPAQRGARYALGSALLRLGRTTEGKREIEAFERMQAEARTREEREWELKLLRQAASVSLEKGDYEQVAEHLRKAITYSPDDATAYVSLGVVLKRLGRQEEAIENFHKALDLKAGFEVHRLLAESYDTLGRPEDSRRHGDIYIRAKAERLRRTGVSR